MSLEHHPALYALNDRLVEEIRSAPRMNWLNTGEDFDWQTYQEHQGRIQQVHFDLNELTERATARLGRILNEDQLARVGTRPPKRTKMNKKGS